MLPSKETHKCYFHSILTTGINDFNQFQSGPAITDNVT